MSDNIWEKQASMLRADLKVLQSFIDDLDDGEAAKAFYNVRASVIAYLHSGTPAEQPAPASTGREPFAWESTTPVYTRFITDERYQKLRPAYQKWYRPICNKCTPVAARELDVEAERRERDPRVDDLAALVKQLVRALRKAAPDHALAAGALDYLKRKDLIGSPLRSPAAQVSTEQAGDAWISVEDRLPDESLLRFLVTGRAESGGPLGVHMATLYEGDMYFEGAAESGGCNPCINSVVTHWMPLPAAPSPNNSPAGADKEPK